MKWEEIKKWLEENKSDEQVKEFINQNADEQEVTLDKVKELAEKDKDIKGWLDGEKDRHHSKALETWKNNNLEKLVDEEGKKRNPEKEPWELEMEKIKEDLERERNEKTRETLKNKALSVAQEKGIPSNLVDYFIGEDEDTTLKNLEALEKEVQPMIQTKVDERLNEGDHKPPNNSDNTKGAGESFIDVIKGEQVKR